MGGRFRGHLGPPKGLIMEAGVQAGRGKVWGAGEGDGWKRHCCRFRDVRESQPKVPGFRRTLKVVASAHQQGSGLRGRGRQRRSLTSAGEESGLSGSTVALTGMSGLFWEEREGVRESYLPSGWGRFWRPEKALTSPEHGVRA